MIENCRIINRWIEYAVICIAFVTVAGTTRIVRHCHFRRTHNRKLPPHTKPVTGELPDPVPTRACKMPREADEAEAAREKEEQ